MSLFRVVVAATPVLFLSSVHVVINLTFTCHVFNAMFVVLSCHLVDVPGSLPRVENATFRGHVLRHRGILLARAMAVLPWLGGPVLG